MKATDQLINRSTPSPKPQALSPKPKALAFWQCICYLSDVYKPPKQNQLLEKSIIAIDSYSFFNEL